MATSPSEEILHRMCIGLRVPELRSELHRRGKDESGRRAELVERLVSCLREEFNLMATTTNSTSFQLLETIIIEIHLCLSWVIMAGLQLQLAALNRLDINETEVLMSYRRYKQIYKIEFEYKQLFSN